MAHDEEASLMAGGEVQKVVEICKEKVFVQLRKSEVNCAPRYVFSTPWQPITDLVRHSLIWTQACREQSGSTMTP
jgi:hypothetical protein